MIGCISLVRCTMVVSKFIRIHPGRVASPKGRSFPKR
jgi:transcription antitermination factor NusG